jgi:hypothetical protein
MGWARGSEILGDIICLIEENVLDDYTRRKLYEGLIQIFSNYDCDTIEECMGISNIFDTFIDGDE